MYIINVEGAIYKEGKWLIIERSAKEEHAGGELALVGGTAENEGNSSDLLERTLKREFYEEVGIVIKDVMHYVRNTTFMLNDGREVLDIVFLCELVSGEPFVKSPDEVENVLWLTADEVNNHSKAPIWLKESLEAAEKIRINSVLV